MHDFQDLRSTLEYLRIAGVDITQVTRAINPDIELINDFLASYRRSDGSWMADEQPLRIYQNPTRGKFPVLMGMFGARQLFRRYLDPHGHEQPDVSDAQLLMRAANAPLRPSELTQARTERTIVKQPDLLNTLPVLRYGQGDPGPTVTLGLVYARDTRSGVGNCSFHRITVKESSLAVGIFPGGHLQQMIDLHVARGERLPVSVNIGLDPAIYLASVLSKPSVPFGFDELSAAGAIRGRSVDIAPCFHNGGWFIDHAEITIEGTLGSDQEFESPDPNGYSMPEYLGYFSPCGMVSTLQVQALTFRPGALYQTLSGPGLEQSALLGLGQECAVVTKLMAWRRLNLVQAVVALPSGGGHLLTVLQIAKRDANDDAEAIAVANALLKEISSLKNLVLIDEDVNPRSCADVLWAMSTRTRFDVDIHVSESLPGTPLDPSQSAVYTGNDKDGFTRKCVIDCTSPYMHRHRFRRAFDLESTHSLL